MRKRKKKLKHIERFRRNQYALIRIYKEIYIITNNCKTAQKQLTNIQLLSKARGSFSTVENFEKLITIITIMSKEWRHKIKTQNEFGTEI